MKAFATAVFVAASAAAFAQAPAQQNQQNPPQGQQNQPQSNRQTAPPQNGPAAGQQQTIQGCLTSAQNVFTLTVVDPKQPGATTPATIAYTLQPAANVDLKSHVNHQIEVKGSDAGQADSKRVVDAARPETAPTGTSGSGAASSNSNAGGKPVVETTAKAKIVAKTFSVASVREIAAKCDTDLQ